MIIIARGHLLDKQDLQMKKKSLFTAFSATQVKN